MGAFKMFDNTIVTLEFDVPRPILVFFDKVRIISNSTCHTRMDSPSTLIALLYYHNATMVHLALGAVLCAILSKLLKLVIRQKRPTRYNHGKKSYGMPSSHSSAVMYFSTVLSRMLLTEYCNGPPCLESSLASWFGIIFGTAWWTYRLSVLPHISGMMGMVSQQLIACI
ncbi:hypothetical protein DL89DRAFT_266955 [Linderina pennispora]|uniref:Phosphatidic acid phosphatase type 2/haloperoxidase domain-containing protein n=1 Tax=Linderina pennispora TaxID=61395 RepID=A0A1Y1WBM6_9FUNG|nr:uncharacterized protein DL89DRAFT_266955 [Linderina pennispora]ORX70842.1 hypothetical protein DL89DRAFT_266955 [Linderina pennispora]